MADTTIRVSEELADELYERKGRSTSYEDYIWNLLKEAEGVEQPTGADEEPEEVDIETTDPTSSVDRRRLEDELAGSGEILDARVDGIVAMYEFLREHGSADKDELLGAVDVETTGYASPSSVWANMVKGRDTLRALAGVEPPPTGRSEWRYVGDRDE